MWYIERLRSINAVSVGHKSMDDEVRIDLGRNVVLGTNIRVDIRHSETNEVVFINHFSKNVVDVFLCQLRKYSPYGYIPCSDDKVAVLTVVDSISVRFLECVKDVELISNPSRDILSAVRHNPDGWELVDDFRSIFACSWETMTLFQLVCHAKEGWIGDDFYFPENNYPNVWHMSFSDINKARTLLAKATVAGYDPLGKYKWRPD